MSESIPDSNERATRVLLHGILSLEAWVVRCEEFYSSSLIMPWLGALTPGPGLRRAPNPDEELGSPFNDQPKVKSLEGMLENFVAILVPNRATGHPRVYLANPNQEHFRNEVTCQDNNATPGLGIHSVDNCCSTLSICRAVRMIHLPKGEVRHQMLAIGQR